ncbi:hypothetical protein CHI05_07290 [Bacillus sp. 7788]|uniref:hypothetical protein n=1 Tax=Bacillus sp. 7788 TaxID=2021692 RepID=UPI000BA54047|nr:hypothetical protein [Bacillus sp. 7788]PAC82313.1 hypothetical protein CHI05_07290 [Bacillus sp. 7788]
MKITNKVLSLLLIFSLFVGAAGFIPQANAVGQDEDEAYLEDSHVIIEEDNDTDAKEELEEIQGVEESSDEGALSEEELKNIKITAQSWDRGGFNGGRIGGGGGGGSIVPKPKPTPKPTPKSKLPAKGFKSGAAGEKFLNSYVGGFGHRTYHNIRVFDHKKGKWVKEKRIVDAYVPSVNAVHESKVGYTSLSNFVRKQVDKDAALRSAGLVRGVKWHFFKSEKTGKIGATKNLRDYLKQKKIPYQYHN